MEEYAYVTTTEVATMLSYNQSTIVRGLEQLVKVVKLGRWAPHACPLMISRKGWPPALLSFEEKLYFLNSMIVIDEKRVFHDNPVKNRKRVGKGQQSEAISKPKFTPERFSCPIGGPEEEWNTGSFWRRDR